MVSGFGEWTLCHLRGCFVIWMTMNLEHHARSSRILPVESLHYSKGESWQVIQSEWVQCVLLWEVLDVVEHVSDVNRHPIDVRRGTAGTRDIVDVPDTQNTFSRTFCATIVPGDVGYFLIPTRQLGVEEAKQPLPSCLSNKKGHLAGPFCQSRIWAHCDVRWVEGPVIGNLSARRVCSARSLRTSLTENHFCNIKYSTPRSAANRDRLTPCGLRPKIRVTLGYPGGASQRSM